MLTLEHIEAEVQENIEIGLATKTSTHPIPFLRGSRGVCFFSPTRNCVLGVVDDAYRRHGKSNAVSLLSMRNAIGLIGLTPVAKPAHVVDTNTPQPEF